MQLEVYVPVAVIITGLIFVFLFYRTSVNGDGYDKKYKYFTFPLPFSGNINKLSEERKKLFFDIFRSDHRNFWNHSSTLYQEGIPAIFLKSQFEYCKPNVPSLPLPASSITLMRSAARVKMRILTPEPGKFVKRIK